MLLSYEVIVGFRYISMMIRLKSGP